MIVIARDALAATPLRRQSHESAGFQRERDVVDARTPASVMNDTLRASMPSRGPVTVPVGPARRRVRTLRRHPSLECRLGKYNDTTQLGMIDDLADAQIGAHGAEHIGLDRGLISVAAAQHFVDHAA